MHNPTAVEKAAMKNRLRWQDAYNRQNLDSAHIIVAHPERYPVGVQEWAALVLQRLERPSDVDAEPFRATWLPGKGLDDRSQSVARSSREFTAR
jgi:hypothetical protein